MNKLYLGDNLDIMKSMKEKTVDLVITDPPFCSQRDYQDFDDRWKSIDDFLEFMELRIIEIHRILKGNGTFYLHCDQAASHYLKVLIDRIFGQSNFRNQISWRRNSGNKVSSKSLPNNCDYILRYTKSNNYIWNSKYAYLPPDEDFIKNFNKNDQDGKGPYYLNSFSLPKKYTTENAIKNRSYKILGIQGVWVRSEDQAKKEIEEGTLIKRGNTIYSKCYLRESKGKQLDNIWTDIINLSRGSPEYTGYQTQKPIRLLQRIIQLSSQKNNLILDPFAGSGTALDAAQSLNRKWIGIDKNSEAIDIIETRLKNGYGMFIDYSLINTLNHQSEK